MFQTFYFQIKQISVSNFDPHIKQMLNVWVEYFSVPIELNLIISISFEMKI